MRQLNTEIASDLEPHADAAAGRGVAISVVVPFYNSSDHFAEMLGSIAAQEHADFEVILVDDGSADGSAEIAEGFVRKDPRFSCLHQRNQGAGAARNSGLEAARGRYVTFLDADDLFEPSFLARMHAAAEASGADVTICRADAFDSASGATLGMVGPKGTLPDGVHEPEEYSRRLVQLFTSVPWDKLFRTDYVHEHGLLFQNLAYSNDNFFVVSALAEANRICVVGKTLAHYRVGTGHSLRDTMSKDPYCDLLALDAVFDRLSAAGARSSELLASFRVWAADTLYLTARDLAMRDVGATRLFCAEFFGSYEDKWDVAALRNDGMAARRSYWRYRLLRGSSVDGFAWACSGSANGRASGYQKTRVQRGLFALRLFLASAFTKSMAKTYGNGIKGA